MDKILLKNVLELAQTKRATLIVFGPKTDWTLRFWINYCKLNTVAKRDPYFTPHMEAWIESLGKVTVFSTLEACRNYWQIIFGEAEKDKTPFISHHGLYCIICMLFGFQNAPTTFQHTMKVILSNMKGQFALFLYEQDIMIFSKTPNQNSDHVCEILYYYTIPKPHISSRSVAS